MIIVSSGSLHHQGSRQCFSGRWSRCQVLLCHGRWSLAPGQVDQRRWSGDLSLIIRRWRGSAPGEECLRVRVRQICLSSREYCRGYISVSLPQHPRWNNLLNTFQNTQIYCSSVPPIFSIRPHDKNVKLGDSVLMQCKVDTSDGTRARMYWQREDGHVAMLPGSKHDHITVDSIGNLRIDGVEQEDEGWFGCFAVSSTGSSSALAKLSLKSNPHQQPPPIIQLGENTLEQHLNLNIQIRASFWPFNPIHP